MDPKALTNFGLTKNEALLYMTLSEIGESKVSAIIKASQFKSGKIYQVLDSLMHKGMVSYVVKNNVKHYVAQNPRKLLEYIRSKKQQIEKEEANFITYLPRLENALKEQKEGCQVRVYEGVESIRNALFSFVSSLKDKSVILLYGANDDKKRDVVLSWPKYNEIARDKKIKTRVIMTSITKEGKLLRKNRNFRNYDKEYRLIKGTDITSFMVSDTMVVLFNFEQPNCIAIESDAYARQFKEVFSVLWQNASEL